MTHRTTNGMPDSSQLYLRPHLPVSPLFYAASDTLAILIFLEPSSRTQTSDTLHLWTSLPESLFSQTLSWLPLWPLPCLVSAKSSLITVLKIKTLRLTWQFRLPLPLYFLLIPYHCLTYCIFYLCIFFIFSSMKTRILWVCSLHSYGSMPST